VAVANNFIADNIAENLAFFCELNTLHHSFSAEMSWQPNPPMKSIG